MAPFISIYPSTIRVFFSRFCVARESRGSRSLCATQPTARLMGPHQVSDRMDYLRMDRSPLPFPSFGSICIPIEHLASGGPDSLTHSGVVQCEWWLRRKWRDEEEGGGEGEVYSIWKEARSSLFSFGLVFVQSRNITILHATTPDFANSSRATIGGNLGICRLYIFW